MRKNLLLLAVATLAAVNLFAQANATPLWLRYPAISPDGKHIAFSYKGNLYKVATGGGDAQILTTNPAYDFMPVWSPDGKTIAFASNRNGGFDIFTIPADGGEPIRLTFHSASEYPSAFTPDGKEIIFKASIQDDVKNVLFPSDVLSELYSVPVAGGRVKQILTTPAESAVFSPDGRYIAYHDSKGYEDSWRKHHQSSVTRDIWIYDTQSKTHKKISSFEGEDRNPVFSADGKTVYYLSEVSGSFNIVAQDVGQAGQPRAISNFTKHPVRFLSLANNTLCFHYNGEIYTQPLNGMPKRVDISIATDRAEQEVKYQSLARGATEMAVSPDGKEVAFVIRGDIFVTSTSHGNTKRITDTPERERSVSFSPDGKKLLYASERDGSWNIYQTSILSDEEPNFALSTMLKEEAVVTIPEEAFQPAYSPNGKEVAFLKERTTLCVANLETKRIRTILDGKYNYSYSDGDQWYQWSPDGNWFVANFMETPSWPDSDVALVKADGSGQFFNLTKSGYDDSSPKWMMGGKAILWFNDKMGMRSHGSWGSQFDVYAMFLTQEAFDEFKLGKLEFELLKEKRKKEKEKKEKEKASEETMGKSGKKNSKTAEPKTKEAEPLKIELDNIDSRKVRLTINSSALSDALLVPDGDKLYYLSRFEKGYDLWVTNLKDNETKLLVKINGNAGNLHIDKEQKNLFLLSNGSLMKVEIAGNKLSTIKFNAESSVNYPKEREYMFEHMWRQVDKKFYDPALHGIDWKFYKSEYSKFLPHINNNFDYAEMMSELLGELNGSHTGCRYRALPENAEVTATLGVFYDFDYSGKGMRIAEVLEHSPLVNSKSKVKAGVIIEKIDGVEVPTNSEFFASLNRKADRLISVGFYNPANGERWTEAVKPIGRWEEATLIYKNWVKKRNDDTERLSNGRIGYVHVQGMNSQSFREVYSDLLGKHRGKEAIIVDTRFNGGGWLHDDLATLLSGKKYVDFMPRGQHIGTEPIAKWYKPSIVLVGEGNYSDAHGFPYVYKALNIGTLVGMPVPGTMTAVWWETQVDPTLVFGIPQIGVKDLNGNYLENQQLYPDIQVAIKPEDAANGGDTQLKVAVEQLLKQLSGN